MTAETHKLSDSPTSEVVARLEQYQEALEKISAIRDSIIGFQNVGWSEHIYPLVAALHEAGFDGVGYDRARENVSTLLAITKAAEDRALTAERLLAEARAEMTKLLKKIESRKDRSGSGYYDVSFHDGDLAGARATLSIGGMNG
jgi:hypothetical protein